MKPLKIKLLLTYVFVRVTIGLCVICAQNCLRLKMVSLAKMRVEELKGQCDGRRPFKFCCDFTACEIITSSNLSISLSVFLQYGAWWRVCR